MPEHDMDTEIVGLMVRVNLVRLQDMLSEAERRAIVDGSVNTDLFDEAIGFAYASGILSHT